MAQTKRTFTEMDGDFPVICPSLDRRAKIKQLQHGNNVNSEKGKKYGSERLWVFILFMEDALLWKWQLFTKF